MSRMTGPDYRGYYYYVQFHKYTHTVSSILLDKMEYKLLDSGVGGNTKVCYR